MHNHIPRGGIMIQCSLSQQFQSLFHCAHISRKSRVWVLGLACPLFDNYDDYAATATRVPPSQRTQHKGSQPSWIQQLIGVWTLRTSNNNNIIFTHKEIICFPHFSSIFHGASDGLYYMDVDAGHCGLGCALSARRGYAIFVYMLFFFWPLQTDDDDFATKKNR